MYKILILFLLVIPCSGLGNTVGTDFQLFNPNTDGKDFNSVESGRGWHGGHLRLGLFLDVGVNTIPTASKNPPFFDSTTRKSPEEILFNIIPTVNLSIFRWLQIGAVLPVVLNTTIESNSDRIDVTAKGVSDARINIKSSIFDFDYLAFSLVGNAYYDLLVNNLFVGDPDDRTGFSLLAALSAHIGDFNYAINFGHKWRNVGTKKEAYSRFSRPIDDQWFGSLAFGINYEKFDLLIESYYAEPKEKFQHALNRDRRSWEILGTVKRGLSEDTVLYLSAGTELMHGIGSSDFRVIAGLDWNMDLWNKNAHKKPIQIAPVLPKKPAKRIVSVSPDDRTAKGNWVVFQLANLHFPDNSSRLTVQHQFKQKLYTVISYLKNNPYLSVQLLGHTDNRGTYEYNALLGKQRAERVKRFLIQHNIEEDTISTVSYSYRRPIATNDTAEGRAKNRRVEIRIEKIPINLK